MCVSLCSKGFSYRQNKEKLARQFLAENNLIESIESINFDDTNIFLDCYVFRKNKVGAKGINFIRNGREKFVSLAELKENDFNFSVTSYLPDDKEEAINIDEVNAQIVKDFL